MEELAHSAGNAKKAGGVDCDAAAAAHPNANNAGMFQRLLHLKSRRKTRSGFIAAYSGDRTGFEFSFLHPQADRARRNGCFFHAWESASRPGKGNSNALRAPGSQTREHSVSLPRADDIIRSFNRSTRWFATGLLGSLIFAALILAVQEWQPKVTDQAKEDRQTSGAALVNANPGPLSKVAGLNAESSTGEMPSGQAISVNHWSTVISPQQNPFALMEIPESAQAPIHALILEKNQPSARANASPGASERPQDSARVIRPKVHNLRSRSPARLRFVDVKMRLLALWHQSLERSQRVLGASLTFRESPGHMMMKNN